MVKLTHRDYTVGWICGLEIEYTAARAMLDEEHEDLEQPEMDPNIYSFGQIGVHNVAIASLPAGITGIGPAAKVAMHMSHTFPSLRFGTLVGIGGGVPSSNNDIRLGDIVVSQPGPQNGGVVQYDFGKTIEEGRFVQTGVLNRPYTILLNALIKVQSNHGFERYGYVENLSNIPSVLQSKFSYPGEENDLLFEANYDHVKDSNKCINCNGEKLKKRSRRDTLRPHVFYGTIACGNQVMRHGETRDKIASQFGGLCFEMEAAGLMDDFPCIVIRGICAYADSHKDVQWEPYAAATAAAYAKELLNVIPKRAVTQTPSIPPSPVEACALWSQTVNVLHSSPMRPPSETSQKIAAALSSSSTESPRESLLVLNRQVLTSSNVALGRLVINPRDPWDNYKEIAAPTDDNIWISMEPQLRHIFEQSRGSPVYEKLLNVFASALNTADPLSAIGSAQEKTYLLSNSGDWFKTACGDHATREWLENNMKLGREIYMVVGIHVIGYSDHNMDLSSGARNEVLTFSEIIIAVQYRKVVFDWIRSRDVDNAFLEIGSNRWEPLVLTRSSETGDGAGEEDIVEATLKRTILAEDVEIQGDIYTVSGQVIML